MPKVLVVGSSGASLPALHAKIAQLTGAIHNPQPQPTTHNPQPTTHNPQPTTYKPQSNTQNSKPPTPNVPQLRTPSRAAFVWVSFALRTTRRQQVCARERGCLAQCDTTCRPSPPAATSETHLDDDAAPSLERLLPSDFAVPVYFICGERCGTCAAIAGDV